jgi:hypothetical protein
VPRGCWQRWNATSGRVGEDGRDVSPKRPMLRGERRLPGSHHARQASQMCAHRRRLFLFPLHTVTVVARSVQDGKNDHRVRSQNEENAVWEPAGENPPNVGSISKARVKQWSLHRPRHGGMNFTEQFETQIGSTIFIPERSLDNIRLRFRSDNEAAAHVPSLARMQTSTSSHELPASGSLA